MRTRICVCGIYDKQAIYTFRQLHSDHNFASLMGFQALDLKATDLQAGSTGKLMNSTMN